MKETIGNTFVIKLVIVFTLLFSAFLALAISYNKVFRMKNEVLSIIEKYEGINDTSLNVINNYFYSNGYTTTNGCPDDYMGVNNFEEEAVEAVSGEKYYFCYKETKVRSNNGANANIKKKVYDVIVFYKFYLPIVGDIFTFNIKGQTKTINVG